MNRYALIDGGKVANVVEQGSAPTIPGQWVACPASTGPGDLYDGTAFTRPAAVVVRHVTVYAFKARMTAAERVAIRTAAASSPSVFDFMDMADSARYIDLSRAETRAGVLALESGGLLATGRALQILDAPVLDVERP